MSTHVEINFASPDNALPHPDLEVFAAKLGQEMEATLEQAAVADGLLTFTEKYAPNLWWITDTVLVEGKRKILGVKIDCDDEPTVHTMAAYLTVALRNQVSDLNLTRALYSYGLYHHTQRYAERLAEYAAKLDEVRVLGEEIFPLAEDEGLVRMPPSTACYAFRRIHGETRMCTKGRGHAGDHADDHGVEWEWPGEPPGTVAGPGWVNPRKVEPAPHGTGVRFTLDNGTVIQVLHLGAHVEVSNVSGGGPNTSGLSVRMAASNRFKITEAR